MFEKLKNIIKCHKPVMVYDEKCEHDWAPAGPEMDLDEILSEIPEEDLCYCEDPKHRMRVLIYIDGRLIQEEYASYYVYPYADSHPCYTYQGKVCLICGECVDSTKDKLNYWKNKVKRSKEAKVAARQRKLIANKMWEDSECHT